MIGISQCLALATIDLHRRVLSRKLAMRQLGSAAKGLRKELQLVGNQFLTPLIYGVPTNICSRAVEAASKYRR
nr:hypothetical protein BSM_06420 [uncultured archaeon]